jgi:hypothetical protein
LKAQTEESSRDWNLLKDGNQIELSQEDIRNIETILKRADLQNSQNLPRRRVSENR